MGTFTLTIKMGSDAMLNAEDVARALSRVAYDVEQWGEPGKVYDDNGNPVGFYQFEGED